MAGLIQKQMMGPSTGDETNERERFIAKIIIM